MSLDRAAAHTETRYAVLAVAVERHLAWARDFTLAGDVDSAVDAIRDAHATVCEMRTSASMDGAH